MESVQHPIAFPALCVPRDFGVYVVRDLAELQQSRATVFWRLQPIDGLRIFDWEGREHKVTSVSLLKPVSQVGRFLARVFDLVVTVDLRTSLIGAVSVSEVISAAHMAIKEDQELFEELSGRPIEWWKAAFAEASSVREIIHAFDPNKHNG
jgi:hypothetical protein